MKERFPVDDVHRPSRLRDDWFDIVLMEQDKELLNEFIDWYAIHYGYKITKENVKIFIKQHYGKSKSSMRR